MNKKRTIITVVLFAAVIAAAMLLSACGDDPAVYTVTYETAGGTVAVSSRSVTQGEDFVLDVPVRDDASFLGWFESADENAAQITDRYGRGLNKYGFADNRTVYAKWSYWDTPSLTYALTQDGKGYTVFAPENFTGEIFKVPAEHNGLPVVRVGEYALFENEYVTQAILPESVASVGAFAFDTCTALETVKGTAGLQVIDERAFYKCTSLREFGFGENISLVGSEAFGGCSLLAGADFSAAKEEVTMEPSAFSGCSVLSSLVLPSRMALVPQSAFSACSALQQVRVEGSVRQIADGAFSGCANMRSLYLGASVSAIGANALGGCTYLSEIKVSEDNSAFKAENNILYSKDGTALYRYAPYKEGESFTVPNSVKRIGAGAFEGGEYLTSLTVGKNVDVIEAGAFRNMKHITEMTLPFVGGSALGNTWFSYVFGGEYSDMNTGVPYTLKNVSILSGNLVAERAFQFCNSLAEIKLPDTVNAVGAYAFYGCSAVANLVLPASVRSIGELAFVACTRLQSVSFGGENEYFASENGVLYDKDKTTLLLYPAGKTDGEITLPSSVMKIADSAFYYASRLKSVTLPEGLLEIGDSAFFNCRQLTDIALPSSVRKIGRQAFADCINLASVTLSSELESIGAQAFYACTRLANVEVSAAEPPAISDALFLDTNDTFAIVFASDEIKAAYVESDWAAYEEHFATKNQSGEEE